MCLFTSFGFGRANPEGTGKPGRDALGKILAQTEESLREFRKQLEARVEEDMVIYSPMFNSGAFQVPWERTAALVESNFVGWKGRWVVLAPPT